MTGGSEDKSETQKWVEDKKVEYLWAYDTEGIIGATGPGFYPGSVLVDAFGTIVWVGNPSDMPKKALEELLDSALQTPIRDWPEEAAAIKEAMTSRNAAQIIAAAEEHDVKGVSKEAIAFAESMVESRVQGLKDLIDDQNAAVAARFAEGAKAQLEGREELEEITEMVEKLTTDKKLIAAAEAQDRLSALAAQAEQPNVTEDEVDDIVKELEGIAKKFKKKAPGRKADELATTWKEIGRKL